MKPFFMGKNMQEATNNGKPDIAAYEKRIRETLSIDETSPTGLRWNSNATPCVRGKPAGRLNTYGYFQVGMGINGWKRNLFVHRIVFFLANGNWPECELDHINGNRIDNRISNLRQASRSANQRNAGLRRDNTSGVKGVSFHKELGKWQAQIDFDGRRIYLGTFASLNDAEKSVKSARDRFHGEFANHGMSEIVAP